MPVRLADVATAPLAAVGGAAGEEKERRSSAQVGTTGAAEATACEEQLRRYPTSAKEDLGLLRRLNTEARVACEEVEKGSEYERRRSRCVDMAHSAELATTNGAVPAEWVEMCVALRAAEKLALERELRERKAAS